MRNLIVAVSLAASLTSCTAGIKTAKDFRPINPSLYDLIQPYKVTDPSQMPWTYQAANPAGRPNHDDWAVLKDTPRLVTAYKVPLPYKIDDSANCTDESPAGASVDVPTNAVCRGFKVLDTPGVVTVAVGARTSNVNAAELSAT